MNFENITHWVQIPLSWFRAVNRLLKTHGGDCITYSQDAEDGPLIALDTRRVQVLIEDQLGGISSKITENSIAGSDENGQLVALLALLSANATKDKVLTVAMGGKALSWEDAGPMNPASKLSLSISGEGSASANTTSWTFGGTKGVQVTLQTRTYYDHTASTPVLYGFYRTFTFDRNGKLYSISGETRYEIDTPVVGNLTT